jgi:phytoene desaturase
VKKNATSTSKLDEGLKKSLWRCRSNRQLLKQSQISICMRSVLVVGAGFGGLAAAALLAKQGHSVTLVEKNDQCGGRAMLWKSKGFTFDMGPSWYLMPDIFETFFAQFGKKPSDYLQLVRLDPSYRLFFGKGDMCDVHADLQKNRLLFESIEPGCMQNFDRYLAEATKKYDLSVQHYLYKQHKSIFDMFDLRMLKEGKDLHVFQNYDSYAKKFFKSHRLRQILMYNIVFLGGAPDNTPAIYSLMAHVDFKLGVWYPVGGMNALAKAMEKLCKEHGVTLQYNTTVEKILVENGTAVGVRTATGDIRADRVVVNADYHHAETKLLDDNHRTYSERYWNKRTVAPSGFIMYLGINKRLSSLQHHNLFLQNDWMNHFDAIFKNPSWPEEPSYYICCPSKTERNEDGDEFREQYAKKIIAHLEKITGEPIAEHVVVRRLFSQKDFISTFNAFKGTGLGLSQTLLQTAFFRPSHQSKKVKNLYYTGQYTHPGTGVPMTVISSQVLVDHVFR